MEYAKQMMKLALTLFELLSEALGLDANHLNDMECAKGLTSICNYYPPCPQPELTQGATPHTDNGFLTILLQDQIGGLQIRHQGHWIDVPPLAGTLIVNVGGLLQASITNSNVVYIE